MKKTQRILSLLLLILSVLFLLSSCGAAGSTTKTEARQEEADKFNSLSDNGWFELYKVSEGKTEELKDKKIADLSATEKASFDKFKADHYWFLTVETEKTTVDKTDYERKIYVVRDVAEGQRDMKSSDGEKIPELDADGNTKKDAEGNLIYKQETYREAGKNVIQKTYKVVDEETKEEKEISRPVVYIEMQDLGLEFITDPENPAQTTLKALEVNESKDFFYFIYMPVGKMLGFFNSIVPSYLLTLFIFAIIVKILLFWFAYKQQKSMVKQAYFKPKERAIRNKYKGRDDRVTQQKMQQEIMDAQRAEGVSAFGGCLPMVIQLPIIMILYQVIISPLRYVASNYSATLVSQLKRVLCYNSVEGLTLAEKVKTSFLAGSPAGITELNFLPVLRDNWNIFSAIPGMADKTASGLPNFYAFGNHIDLSVTPSITFSWPVVLYLLIPIITFVALYFSMKLNRKLTGAATQPADGAPNMGAANKIMDFAMPALSTFFTFLFPALLGIYWIFNNLLGTAQQVLLNKLWPLPKFTEEDYKQAEREYNKGKDNNKRKQTSATVSDPNAPRPKSLHHIDDEDDEEYPDLPPIDEDVEPVIEDKKKGKGMKASMKDDEVKPGTEENKKDGADKSAPKDEEK